jgi:hypothetical protein
MKSLLISGFLLVGTTLTGNCPDSLSKDQVMNQLEIDETQKLIEMYSKKIDELKQKIDEDKAQAPGIARPRTNPFLKNQDFDYLMTLVESEVNSAPIQKALQDLEGAELYRQDLTVSDSDS